MDHTAAVGVIGGGLVVVSFLILGTELLKPQGIIPEGIDVAKDLSRLLSDVWGNFGFWLLIIGITIALAGTILSNQDGWGRMFADATLILFKPWIKNVKSSENWFAKIVRERAKLRNAYAVTIGAVIPVIVLFLVQNPVDILSVAGVVAAAHTPVVVFLTLYLNLKRLPQNLKPGAFSIGLMIVSGLFFTAFAVYHFANL